MNALTSWDTAVRPVGALGGDLGWHRHRRADAARRHLLPRALQEHVRALRRVLARRRSRRRAAHSTFGLHHLRHAQPRLAGLHRRLGRRAAVVHGPGHGGDPALRARSVGEPAARAARGRRHARARQQQRAARHLLVGRGPDAVLVPRDRPHGRGDRDGRRLPRASRPAGRTTPTPPRTGTAGSRRPPRRASAGSRSRSRAGSATCRHAGAGTWASRCPTRCPMSASPAR